MPAASPTTPATLSPPAISAQRVRVVFAGNQPVLRDLNLELPAGQVTCLLGPSGCGKSTLLKCFAGLLRPESGSVSIGEATPDPNAQRMSFVFQDPTLLPWRSVRDNVLLPLELKGLSQDQSYLARADHFLGIVGLSANDQRKYPSQLSGGMKMRASLARALATDPDILLLDEPFAALDDVLRNKLNELLLQLVSERPRTVVFVTHNIAEAIFLSDQIAIIGKGVVQRLIDNPLPKPRQRSSRATPQFAQLFGVVSTAMEGSDG